MSLLTQFRAKKKRDEEDAAKRKAARISRKVARTAPADDGLSDLPLAIAVAMEENPAPPKEPETAPAPTPADDSVPSLVARLTAIRERLFRLQAVWSTTLSYDIYQEADQYREVFRALGEQLKAKDPAEFDKLTCGHEALLLAEPSARRPSLPLAVQRWFELTGELQNMPVARVAPKPDGYVADGLQSWI